MTSLSVEETSVIRSPVDSVALVATNVSLPIVPVKVSSSVVSVKVWPAVAPPPDLIEVIVEATLVVAA